MNLQTRAEKIVINEALLNPGEVHKLMDKVDVTMFIDPVNKIIFKAITDLFLSQQPINTTSLAQEVFKSKALQKQEAAKAISEMTSFPTGHNELPDAINYLICETIKQEHVSLAQKVSFMTSQMDYAPENVLNLIQDHITNNKYKALINKRSYDNQTLLDELEDKMRLAAESNGVSGIRTGYHKFDEITSGMQPTNLIVVAARPGAGKELKVTSLVYTPEGNMKIGDSKIGDKILGSDGKEYSITGVFPQGMKDVYRIWFDDGSFVDSGLEHQWEVTTRAVRKTKHKTPIVVTTKDMLRDVILKDGRKNYSIRMCQPLHFNEKELTINPYVLGALIGDGCFQKSNITFSNSEKDVLNKINSLLPDNHELKYMRHVDYNIISNGNPNLIFKMISDLGLKNKRSYEKFIPKNYLYNSVENRIELLRGLLDTDGYVTRDNSIEYSTTSEQLCHDIIELIRGLGGKASFIERQGSYRKDGERIETRKFYRISLSFSDGIVPVSSIKHLSKYKGSKKYHAKFISKIEKMDYQEEMICISVDAPDCLYITDGYTLTHNTQMGLGIMKAASIRNKMKGLFISCEMDEVQVMKRLIAVDSGVNGYSIKKGKLSPQERGRFERSKRRIAQSGVKIVGGSFTITDIVTMVYKMKYTEGLDYIVLDYIQKITSPGAQNRTNEVGDVSRKLKDMANELKIPIVALAQLSRAVEMRTDKRPILSDLRESGDIEQDADIVAFLYRPAYYLPGNERDTSPIAKQAFIYIAKHRDGELADIELEFESEIPAWRNMNEIGDYDDDVVQTSIERFDNNNDDDYIF